MGYLDYAIIGIIGVCAITAFYRGLIKTIFSLFSIIIGIAVTYMVYPFVSSFLLKNTKLLTSVSSKVASGLKLESLSQNSITPQDHIELVEKLKIPEQMKNILLENKNAEVFDLLNATKIDDYISSAIGTMIINIIVFAVVMIICMLLIKIIAKTLDIMSYLPVIKQLNKLGGLFFGLIQGVLVSWAGCLLLSVLINMNGNEKLLAMLYDSPIALFFYENNILLYLIGNIGSIVAKLN